MSLRTWLIKLLGGEPRLSAADASSPTNRRSGDRVVTAGLTVAPSGDEAADDVEEEEIGSLSLTTEMDELLYLTSDSVTHFDLLDKGVSIVYAAGKLRLSDTLGGTIFIGASGPGKELLKLPLSDKVTYDIFFNQAAATLIIAGNPGTGPDEECKLHLFPIDERRVSISRGKASLIIREG